MDKLAFYVMENQTGGLRLLVGEFGGHDSGVPAQYMSRG